jgi:hypothetical protein
VVFALIIAIFVIIFIKRKNKENKKLKTTSENKDVELLNFEDTNNSKENKKDNIN